MKHIIYLVCSILTIIAAMDNTVPSGRKNRLRGTRWWTLSHEYQQPKSYLETNSVNSIHNQNGHSANNVDKSFQLLTKKQRKLVAKNEGSLPAVAQGAQVAIEECQLQFENRRWNCPTKDTGRGGSIFGKILNIGCRETAFIYAITSAGVAHSIARACSEGTIATCSCDNRLDQPGGQDWKWGGCGDNVNFGYKFSRQFVDSVEKGQDLRFMINKQNNEAGRRHVLSETTQQCKCHGMSGSCAIKTCWMRLPSFKKVGQLLKDRFDGASLVYAENSVRKSQGKRFSFTPVDRSHKAPGRKDMAYFEDSPDFCAKNSKFNFEGTSGRECNATSMGIDGCELMCCGRGYTTETYTSQNRCSCSFKWCCEVTCQVCTKQNVRHICN